MTERDWLEATDPQPMLAFLRNSGRASNRKLLRVGAACRRRLLALFPGGELRRAVECGERAADGQGTPDERVAAMRRV